MEARRGPLSLTHDQVAELQETFNLFDLAGEGVIEMPRVKAFMLKLTPGLTKDLYARVISDAKLEGTDAINFAQFFLIVSTIGTVLPHSGKYNLDQLREVFEAFDPRHNGYIDLNHFMQIMLEEGEPLSQVEGKELILHLHRFGCLRKGEVNYRKFMSKVFSSDPAKVFSSSP
ncbi:ATP-binding protein cassette, sub-family E, member 1 [Trypanosoma grayi]|uniref:ATP-binding protein cassette, sub-family E, member 1 n=1 Tax=Trypanosoma grayi TaxID=71804 RepID=UPI0004F46B94|nr:ATP-binding protein cassette, sub-family E, member 1 [Trypanosoma grayi]KEG12082.1 ATP-binding protein cassette, sub-family E, member 1 [Trypanosoma grayi]